DLALNCAESSALKAMLVRPTVALLKARPDLGSTLALPSSNEPSFNFSRAEVGAAAAATAEPKIRMARHRFTDLVFPENGSRAKSKLSVVIRQHECAGDV